MRKGWTSNFVLMLATLGVCLVLSEAVLRLSGHQPVKQGNVPLFTYSDTLGWIGKANFQTEQVKGPTRIDFSFNRWGFRDRQPPPPDSITGRKRLMFLGDSFIMGLGSPQQDRATDQLQAEDSTVYCYNCGIDGYSTDQELLVLEKFGPAIKPDAVLLFFCINDLIANESDMNPPYSKPQYHLGADGSLVLGNIPVPQWTKRGAMLKWFRSHFALVSTLDEVRANLMTRGLKSREGGDDRRASRARDARTDTTIRDMSVPHYTGLTVRLLKEMQSQCRRLGADFIVFSVPSSYQWTATRDQAPDEILDVLNGCRQAGLKTVDLFPVFRQDFLQNGQTQYIYDNCHWNRRGGRLVAQQVQLALEGAPKKELLAGN